MASSEDPTQGPQDSAQRNASDLAGPPGSDSGPGEFETSSENEMPSSGPEISGNDLIAGNTGIGGTGASTESEEPNQHDPGGTPTV